MKRRPPDRIAGFACLDCEREEPAGTDRFTCPACGGNLDVLYDYDRIGSEIDRDRIAASTDRSLWRYRALLPLHGTEGPPPLPVGGTALIPAGRLGERLGFDDLWLKEDITNPTASFKDRASLVAALEAVERGARTVTCASTGNAASSLACVSASLGLECVIFVPERAPLPKLTQILLYGARVFRVRGTYDDAFDLCTEAAGRFGWYTRSTGVNPFTAEGKKTAAFEIAEALRWEAPDRVIVPTGDGNILGGVGKGFRELKLLGWTGSVPKMTAVQAAGCAPIVRAVERGSMEIEPVEPETVADSISVGHPRDGKRALRMIAETGGTAVAVDDRSILEAMRELPAETGLFAEPSAAASLAGLKTMGERGTIDPGEKVVLMITGNGLKDVATAAKLPEEPPLVEPELAAVEKALQEGGGG